MMGLFPDGLTPLTEKEEQLIAPLARRLKTSLDEIARLRAALERIADRHTVLPHVSGEIAKAALQPKEGEK